MKKSKYLLLFVTLFLLVPTIVNASPSCAKYVKKDGTILWYGATGNLVDSENTMIAECGSRCSIKENVDKFPDYPEPWIQDDDKDIGDDNPAYCIRGAYGSRGCFTGAMLGLNLAYGSVAQLGDPELIEIAKNAATQLQEMGISTDSMRFSNTDGNGNTCTDQNGNPTVCIRVQDLLYSNQPNQEVQKYFLTNVVSKVCSGLISHGVYNNDATLPHRTFGRDIELVYGDNMNQFLAYFGGSSMGKVSNIGSINSALDRGQGILLSTKGGKDCPANIFTNSTHYISIVARDGDRYLVYHSGTKVKSGWYSQADIQTALSCQNRGAWVFEPKNCYSVYVEVGDSCACDTNTGIYTYTKTQNGTSTTETCDPATDKDKCQGFITNHSCPKTCSKTCSNNNGTYTCKEGNICDEDDYRRECTHTCQTPAESGDGNYYCKESSPGKGDGPVCDEAKYTKQCKCDEWESKCENNQNPTDPDCEKYNKYCVDCTPNVYMPSTCNDFDINSSEKGVISDIAQSNAGNYSCQSASDVPRDQVKACVINHNDSADNTFEATVSSGLTDNPYCRVWCKESYDFGVPTAQTTRSGGYFTISASLSGTRDCYVSGKTDPTKGIDRAQLNDDLKEYMENLEEHYNEYIKYYHALNDGVIKRRTDKGYRRNSKGKLTSSVCARADQYYINSLRYDIIDIVFNEDNTVNYINPKTTRDYDFPTDGYATSEKRDGSGGCEEFDGSEEGLRAKLTERMNKAKSAYDEDVKKIHEAIMKFNSCSGNIVNPEDPTLTVTGWQNNMIEWSKSSGPQINFKYNEDYMSSLDGKLVGDDFKNSSSEMYCFGDTDATYKCVSGGSTNDIKDATTTTKVVYCTENECHTKDIIIGKSTWVQKTMTQSATYKPNNKMKVRSQYGTIKFDDKACNGSDCLYTKLPENALPVSLIRKSGVFPFVLSYKNIGQCNDASDSGTFCGETNKAGRLLITGSNEKTVVTAYTEKVKSGEYKKCKIDSLEQSAGYVCHYLVDCDECKFKCDPDGQCYFEDCEDGNCKFTCKDCIFDGDHATYNFRPVSLTTLFPNDGKQSGGSQLTPTSTSRSSSASYNWTNGYKGDLTRKIIEGTYNASGEVQINNTTIKGGDRAYEEPEYSYILTAANLNEIRKYNNRAGSFTNSSIPQAYTKLANRSDVIYCSTVEVNNLIYSVKCNSTFLDILEKDKSLAAESKRPDSNHRFILFTDLIKYDSNLASSCSNNSCINRENAIGPSWK